MISITINCESAADALRELRDLAGGMAPATVIDTPPAGGVAVPAVSVLSDTATDTTDAEPEKAAPKPRGRPKKAAEIPAPAEPTAETAAQDATDEAAESAAQAPKSEEPAKEVFTLDTLRRAAGEYLARYGAAAAQADLPKVIGFEKLSAVPDDKCEAATLAVRAALASNPNNHPVVAAAA